MSEQTPPPTLDDEVQRRLEQLVRFKSEIKLELEKDLAAKSSSERWRLFVIVGFTVAALASGVYSVATNLIYSRVDAVVEQVAYRSARSEDSIDKLVSMIDRLNAEVASQQVELRTLRDRVDAQVQAIDELSRRREP